MSSNKNDIRYLSYISVCWKSGVSFNELSFVRLYYVSRHSPFYSQGDSIRRDYFFDILLAARKDLEGLLFVRSCVKYVPP